MGGWLPASRPACSRLAPDTHMFSTLLLLRMSFSTSRPSLSLHRLRSADRYSCTSERERPRPETTPAGPTLCWQQCVQRGMWEL